MAGACGWVGAGCARFAGFYCAGDPSVFGDVGKEGVNRPAERPGAVADLLAVELFTVRVVLRRYTHQDSLPVLAIRRPVLNCRSHRRFRNGCSGEVADGYVADLFIDVPALPVPCRILSWRGYEPYISAGPDEAEVGGLIPAQLAAPPPTPPASRYCVAATPPGDQR